MTCQRTSHSGKRKKLVTAKDNKYVYISFSNIEFAASDRNDQLQLPLINGYLKLVKKNPTKTLSFYHFCWKMFPVYRRTFPLGAPIVDCFFFSFLF